MTNDEIVKNYLAAFGAGVPDDVLKKNVIASHNHMWHIFGCGNEPDAEGDDARRAFDKLSYDEAIIFRGGYSVNNKPRIEDVEICTKISSATLDYTGDVYVVDKWFEWTYVNTHEDDFGPYFAYRAK